jgi:hypothetical protein
VCPLVGNRHRKSPEISKHVSDATVLEHAAGMGEEEVHTILATKLLLQTIFIQNSYQHLNTNDLIKECEGRQRYYGYIEKVQGFHKRMVE